MGFFTGISDLIEAIKSLGIDAGVTDRGKDIVINIPLIDLDFGNGWVLLKYGGLFLLIMMTRIGLYYSMISEWGFIKDYEASFSIREGKIRIILSRIPE